MKYQKLRLSSQLLILIMASLVLTLMVQLAQAQDQSQNQNIAPLGRGNYINTYLPQKTLSHRLLESTSFTYYHQFLGPTIGGAGGESYNVFQDSRTPYQSFHGMNLRFTINPDWAVGASLAAVNAYGETTTSNQNGFRGTMLRDEFFNARAYVSIPAWKSSIGTLFTTISYEAPTGVFARKDNMRYGLVLAQSFSIKLPSNSWATGLTWQYYRAYYEQNVVPSTATTFGIDRQTTIVSGGPYLNYRFSDKWMVGSSLILDWDQRGDQTSTTNFNNNLPDRTRVGVTYNPTIKHIASVGIFSQQLVKYTTDTQAFGAEFTLRF